MTVADSSVLIVYARAGRLSLLRDVFGEFHVPQAVRVECVDAAPERPDARVIAEALGTWITTEDAPPREVARLARLHPNLGRGELEALALTAERHETLLVDDSLARRAARLERVETLGSLGILMRAHRQRVLPGTRDVARALRAILGDGGLWVGPDVVEAFWDALGGRP